MSQSQAGHSQKQEKNSAVTPRLGRGRWTICAMQKAGHFPQTVTGVVTIPVSV
jgi:hypothetical protein